MKSKPKYQQHFNCNFTNTVNKGLLDWWCDSIYLIMANYNRNSHSYGGSSGSQSLYGFGSSTIPSVVGGRSSASSSSYGASSLGTGGYSGSGSSRSGDMSSTQLKDAAFAARVLGLPEDLASDLMRSSSQRSASSGSRSLLGAPPDLGSADGSYKSSYGKSSGTGYLSQQEPQQIRSIARDVPLSSR